MEKEKKPRLILKGEDKSKEFIRGATPTNPPKVKKVQVIEEVLGAVILGPYDSQLPQHRELPRPIYRGDKEKKEAFIKRLNKELDTHIPDASIQWKTNRKGIQHRDYLVNNGG